MMTQKWGLGAHCFKQSSYSFDENIKWLKNIVEFQIIIFVTICYTLYTVIKLWYQKEGLVNVK